MNKAVSNTTTLKNGIRLFWTSQGRKTSRVPIVMLHGLNDSLQTWDRVASKLAKSRQVFIPDLPGHGFSDRPDASYELDWYADVLTEWFETLGLSQFDLIGHSFGGGVAQVLLLKCRERVRRLILVSSGGLGRDIAFVLRLASIPFVLEKFGQPFMKISTHIALKLAKDGRPAEDIAKLCEHNAKSGSARAFSRTVRSVIDWRGQRRSYGERMHQVSDLPPILVLWGAEDGIIPVAHAQEFLKSLGNVRFFLFKGCGHYLHYQEPDLFVEKVLEFMDSHQSPTFQRNLPSRLESPAAL